MFLFIFTLIKRQTNNENNSFQKKKKKQKRFVKVIKINLRRAILLCLLVKKKQFLEYNTYQPVGNALTYTRREPVVNENEIGKQIFLADNKTL